VNLVNAWRCMFILDGKIDNNGTFIECIAGILEGVDV
jgi:hypothetical protein